MALDSGFMASLMTIPYFKDLVEQNGEAWLESVFNTLETEDYDFSRFIVPDSVSQSIDEAIEADLAALETDIGDVVTSSVATEMAAEKKVAFDGASAPRRSEAQEAVPAMAAEPQMAASAGSSDANGGNSGPKFDNDEPKNEVTVPFNSEMIIRYLSQWLAMFYPDEHYTAAKSESGVTVGLNGIYSDLKLSDFDDRIYTADGKLEATVNAGAGSDTLYITQGGLKADLGGISDFGKFGGKVNLNSVENVVGSDGDDTIFGNQAANKLAGRGGDDKIDGGGGNDTITGGAGENNLSGGAGDDSITGGGAADVVDGGSGKDTIKAGGGADKVSGGEGDDSIEGGAGDDGISGGAGNDTIKGDAGKDTIDGGAGNDTINGGDGDDKVTGGDGDDILNADAGNDTVEGGKGKDTIRGNDGNDTIKGDDGADKLFGDAGNDTIDGGADADEINGGDGDDTLAGGDGDDTLLGGAGKDKIDGGAGVDKVTGGLGADTLTGGAGADTFLYTSKDDSGTAADTFDIITDFDVANDKIDLAAVLANDVFDFVATEGGAFTGTGPEVRWDQDNGRTLIEIDVDGNGTADMKIELDDLVNLTASNFNL